MWKYVTSAVRNVIDKGNGFFHCRSLNIQECGNYNNIYERRKQNQFLYSETQIDDGEEKKDSYKDDFSDPSSQLNNSFLRALTCSSAMVLGWYFSHFLCLKEKYSKYLEIKKEEKLRFKYINIIKQRAILPHTVWTQPINLKSINNDSKDSLSTEAILEKRDNAIKDAAEQFAIVTGNLENQLGTACLQQSQEAAGIEHFEAGALYKNASAAFNLGLCYELGIGTTQNYEKAAKCYQIAAELGHTKAMYNLAIYHVHGYGGLRMDFNRARLLFIAAAKKGHKESIQALSSECELLMKKSHVTNKAANSSLFIPLLNNA